MCCDVRGVSVRSRAPTSFLCVVSGKYGEGGGRGHPVGAGASCFLKANPLVTAGAVVRLEHEAETADFVSFQCRG